ncbi:hypothetical protein GS452_07260 [Rhodococcus hoagii]|nr:hypothetical protein [Prescottella equi]
MPCGLTFPRPFCRDLRAVRVDVVAAELADDLPAVPRERDAAHDHVAQRVDSVVAADALDFLRGEHVLAVRTHISTSSDVPLPGPRIAPPVRVLRNPVERLRLVETEQVSSLVPAFKMPPFHTVLMRKLIGFARIA